MVWYDYFDDSRQDVGVVYLFSCVLKWEMIWTSISFRSFLKEGGKWRKRITVWICLMYCLYGDSVVHCL